jgi:hypothetical protein
MASRRVLLHVVVAVDDSTISGKAAAEGGDRAFSGRVGLLASIDDALDAPDEPNRSRSLGHRARNQSARK